MTIFYLHSATQTMTFLMVSTDHLTGATGQSPIVRFSKNGATAFSTATQAVTEMQYGWYKLTLATNNCDTIGELAVHATATGTDDTDEKHYVGPAPANVTYWASATVITPNTAGVPVVDLIRVHGTLATTAAAHLGVNVYSWATATGTVPAPNTAGVPLTDLVRVHGTLATTAAAHLGVNVYAWATATGLVPAPNQPGRPLVDMTHIHGATATTTTAHIGVRVVSMATDSIVANTLATSGVDKIADQVWDEAMSGHTSTGSAGDYLDRIKTSATDIQTRLPATLVGGRMDSSVGNVQGGVITATGFAAGAIDSSALAASAATEIATYVWDEAMATHTATNTAGDYLIRGVGGAGATASDTWTTALPGAYAAGSAGYILGTYLDATVSSRSTATQAPTAVENADALLNRDMSLGTDSGSATVRTPRQAFRFLRNKWTLATTGALTVYKEDDSTSSWTATATGDSSATPITGLDPA